MEKFFEWVINHDEISILCCPKFLVVNTIKKLGIEADNINYDINFSEMSNVICKDFVFDDVPLRECVFHYNCEKTYPVGRMHKGIFILRGDDENHNGDCNPVTSIDQLIEENEITDVIDSYHITKRNKNYYYVYGTNI